MTSKKEKLYRILEELHSHYFNEYGENRFNPAKKIKRFELRRRIQKAIDIVARNQISAWINLLLAKGYIKPNPTSEYIRQDRYTKKFMPNNETRYFINIHEINGFLTDFETQEEKQGTHATSDKKQNGQVQTTLELAIAPESNNSTNALN